MIFHSTKESIGLEFKIKVYQTTILAGLAFLAVASGCSSAISSPDYSELALVKVSGLVTLDGKPLADVEVRFHDPDGTFSSGITDSDGHYQQMFDSQTQGVVPGKKRVSIIPKSSSSEEAQESVESANKNQTDQGILIPECYANGSKLLVEVTDASSNQNFELSTSGL